MIAISPCSPKERITFFNSVAWKSIVQIMGASVFLGLCSQIKIHLPFTPIPLTLQTLAVLLIGASLGSRKGAWAILIYFIQILAGFPVLSGGTSDALIFLGPKGGYVLGFLAQAFLMGMCVEKIPGSKPVKLFVGATLACAVQMSCGVLVLSRFLGWNSAWAMGMYPFLPIEIFKILVISWGLNLKKMTCLALPIYP